MTYDDMIAAVLLLGALYDHGALATYDDELTERQYEVGERASNWAFDYWGNEASTKPVGKCDDHLGLHEANDKCAGWLDFHKFAALSMSAHPFDGHCVDCQ